MLGKTLVNRYRIDTELGHGGMGVVYQGYDTFLNRPVAIKAISASNINSEARSRLLSEARAVAKLNHPNIVTVYDALEEDGVPFIIMELVEGHSLRFNYFVGFPKVIDYIRQICAALVHAHGKGVIHRDIKPDNVLLSPNGSIKLMDFGLALSMDSARVTDAGILVGTFAYIAPELIQGGQPSPQSDLYALGVMLYELLTGDLPFQGSDIAHLFAELLRGNAPSPKDRNPEVPDMLNTLVMQMLSKNPLERPSSAHMVDAALILLQSDRATTGPGWIIQPNAQTLAELANSRAPARQEWEKDWRRKSYPKSTVPVLGPGEKELIISNREKELAGCISHLEEHRLLVITGMPGIGKSTLARALLEFMPPASPPPFWYDFDRQKGSGNSLGILLDRIASYLEKCLGGGVREEILSFRNGPDQQASINDVDVMTDYLNQDKSMWMVFDNLETVLAPGSNKFTDPALEYLFEGLKNNQHNARIIITSPLVPVMSNNEYLLEFGSQPLTLSGLNETAAIKFLRANGLQDDVSDETLATIVSKVNGHPFALKHVARYILTLGIDAALDSLQGGLDDFLSHFESLLHQRLTADEYAALQSLAVLQREIPIDGLKEIGPAKPAMIKRWAEAGFLAKNQAANFWLPSLVKLSLQPEDSTASRSAHLRALEYYKKQPHPLAPKEIDDYASALEWHHHAIQAGEAHSAYEALFETGMNMHLKKWNEFTLLVELCEHTFATVKQKPLSKIETINLNRALGAAYYYLVEFSKSADCFATAALDISGQDDPQLMATNLADRAESEYGQGKFDLAEELCEQVLAILAHHPDEYQYARIIGLKGISCRAQGQLELAIQYLEKSRKLFQEQHKMKETAYITGELGIVYYYLNQFDSAVEYYRHTVRACEQIKDARGVMVFRLNTGDVLLQQGEYEKACDELSYALDLAHKKRFYTDEISSGLYLAEAQIALGLYEQAQITLEILKPSLLRDKTNSFAGQTLRLQAVLDWRQGRLDAAKDKFERTFTLLQGKANTYERACAHLDYAEFLKNMGYQAQSRKPVEDAIEGFKQINNYLGLQRAEKTLQELENYLP